MLIAFGKHSTLHYSLIQLDTQNMPLKLYQIYSDLLIMI